MQLTGDLKPVVSVAAQQGMYFNQQPQNQAVPSANQTDTYCSVSQSQTINFTQQSLRQRAAAAAAAGGVPQPGAAGPGARGHPQQVSPAQVDQHQHAKHQLLQQQQQLMRAQQVNAHFVHSCIDKFAEGGGCVYRKNTRLDVSFWNTFSKRIVNFVKQYSSLNDRRVRINTW